MKKIKRKILIVEDEEEIYEFINNVALQIDPNLDIETVHARDGIEAFRQMEIEKFDLITLDINMPIMGGSSLIEARRIKKNLNKMTQIIVLTAFSHNLHYKTEDKLYVLEKPISADRLTKVLKLFLKINDNENKTSA